MPQESVSGGGHAIAITENKIAPSGAKRPCKLREAIELREPTRAFGTLPWRRVFRDRSGVAATANRLLSL